MVYIHFHQAVVLQERMASEEVPGYTQPTHHEHWLELIFRRVQMLPFQY